MRYRRHLVNFLCYQSYHVMVIKKLQLITLRTKIHILLQGFGKNKYLQTDNEIIEIRTENSALVK